VATVGIKGLSRRVMFRRTESWVKPEVVMVANLQSGREHM